MISHVAPGCGELYSGVVAGRARKLSFYEAKEGGESRSGCGGGQSESREEALGGEKWVSPATGAPRCGELHSGVVAGRARKVLRSQATGKRVSQRLTTGAVSLSHGRPRWAGPGE